MFRHWRHPAIHRILVVVTAAMLTLPQIGRTALWDDDEALNAEAAREMLASSEWIVPTFNFRLRDAKPVLLYWCQIASYRIFGVNEFAARFPSAVALMVAGLAAYELGRRMFSPITGLLASLMLMTSGVIVWLGGFATPDAILLACTTLTFLCFWMGYTPAAPDEQPRDRWFVPVGAVCGIAVLAKGPIGILLPAAVIATFLFWNRQLRLLWNRRLIYGLLAFAVIAAPWYIMVSAATRGAFARGFFLTNNIHRFQTPMEMHGGSIFYHPLILLVGFSPWSLFCVPFFRQAVSAIRSRAATSTQSALVANRLLICWIGIYLLFFSCAATKLPSYTAPLYPALALLLASFLARWWRGDVSVPRWTFVASFGGIAVAGGIIIGCMSTLGRAYSLDRFAWVGLPAIVIGFAGAAATYLHWRRIAVAGLVACHISNLIVIGQLIIPTANAGRAGPLLVAEAGTCQPRSEIRLAAYQYTQPSLVFYSRREVRHAHDEAEALEILNGPLPTYLFVSELNWRRLQSRMKAGECEIVARRFDAFRGGHVVVVTNRHGAAESVKFAQNRSAAGRH